jgi:L-Ala-D/L-Glu epimerase
MRTLTARAEQWPLAREFRISRARKSVAQVVVVEIAEGAFIGHGECLPYPRYGESPASVLAQIESVRADIESGCTYDTLQSMLPPGAARNGLDSALIDLAAKKCGQRAWQMLGIEAPQPVVTAYTLTLDDPERMAANAAEHRGRRLLKLKLGPDDALDCVRAVRTAAPDAGIIVDANEAWSLAQLETAMDGFLACRVAMIEQPLPAVDDHDLAGLNAPIPIGADESCHTREGVEALADRYQVVNIKLDKTGGLTEAIRMRTAARDCGLDVMVGCMLATSLSMAPAMLITPGAGFVDLDGPLLMRNDRSPGLRYDGDLVFPPEAELWG